MRTVDRVTLARTERAALADLFQTLGPDQPTLDDGWQTGDLLTHLLVRERRPDGVLAGFVKPLAGYAAQIAAGYATRPWSEQIELFRSGPPRWNPTGWGKLDDLTNSGEMFIHHEDARRGQSDWQPRALDPVDYQQIVRLLESPLTRMAIGKAGVGVSARLTDDADRVIELRSGTPTVQISGGAVEILLWTAGRRDVRVQLDGDPTAVASLASAKRGR